VSKFWHNHSEEYEIATDVYSGPLDLLLDLIEKAELDITKLALAQVTDQFLEYIHEHQDADPEYISSFLLIASKLIQIKSEALLPHPPAREEEEDLGNTLAQQLRLYRQIKASAKWLNERINANLRNYVHVPETYTSIVKVDLSGIGLQDLVSALNNLLTQGDFSSSSSLISIPKITLKQKISEILHLLQNTEQTSFQTLVGDDRSRLNIIVVFLAILELVKQNLVKIDQSETFADIQISAQEDLSNFVDAEISIED